MRKPLLFLGLLLFMTAPAVADIILDGTALSNVGTVLHPDGRTYYAGAVQVKTDAPLTIYAANTYFRTFCVEVNEHIYVPGQYDVTDVSGSAYLGGLTGGSPDPLDQRTAWLYSHYLDGTLDDAVAGYTNNAAGNVALQTAIWYIEGEWVNGSLQTGSITGLALDLLNAAGLNSSIGDLGYVSVMNLDVDGDSTTPAQSLLVATKSGHNTQVPAPGAALLVGLGLALIGWIKRRIA